MVVELWAWLSVVGGGGAEGDRTPDLLLAKQALSQLSYGPNPPHNSPYEQNPPLSIEAAKP